MNRRKASRVKRLVSLVAACAALVLGGCKDPTGSQADAATGLLHPASDIAIVSLRTYATGDAVAGSNDVYYVVALRYTNDRSMAFAPSITHFVVQDAQNRRFFGIDSGSAALVGISNDDGPVKTGETHDYTIGFRVPRDTTGTLFYDTSF